MTKNKKFKVILKESQVTEWCEFCPLPAYKCKNGCKGIKTDNDTIKQYGSKEHR